MHWLIKTNLPMLNQDKCLQSLFICVIFHFLYFFSSNVFPEGWLHYSPIAKLMKIFLSAPPSSGWNPNVQNVQHTFFGFLKLILMIVDILYIYLPPNPICGLVPISQPGDIKENHMAVILYMKKSAFIPLFSEFWLLLNSFGTINQVKCKIIDTIWAPRCGLWW